VWTGLNWLSINSEVGSYEQAYDNEPSGYIKDGEILDYVSRLSSSTQELQCTIRS